MLSTDVAIVGAGPYGLSLAAQLRSRGVAFRIFGLPMHNWRQCMPAGMHLKSDGFASDLYDAERGFTLKKFCAERGIVYDDEKIPVLIETFIAYGLAFQAQMVPNLEQQLVISVKRASGGFELELQNGESVRARRVVVATGISYIGNVPGQLAQLGAELCTHSSAHHELSGFAGKQLVIVGGGASAIDLAALLHAAGASVQVVSRHRVHYSQGPGKGRRSLWQRIRKPHLGLGASLRSALYTLFPNLFHLLPRALRLRIVRRHLGPGAGWFIRPQIEGIVPVHEGYSLQEARVVDGGAELQFSNEEGRSLALHADHVVAATGYKPAVSRLPFLEQSIIASLALEDQSPVLTRNFESSVPGLYFMGVIAANSFGPLLRFALGAGYCSRHLANHLSRARADGSLAELPVSPQRSAD